MIAFDYHAVREVVLDHVPELRDQVERYEREVWGLLPGEDGWMNSLIESIVWVDLKDAAARQDMARLRRGARLVEVLMRDGVPDVQNDVIIGVVKPLAQTPALRESFNSFGLGWIVQTGDKYNDLTRGPEGRCRNRPRRWHRFWGRER